MTAAIKKKEKEPSAFLAYFFAVLMAFIGMILGMMYLFSFPLQAFSSIAEQQESINERDVPGVIPGDAFYIEGPILRTEAWKRKRELLLSGAESELVITAGEINAWLAAEFNPIKRQGDDSDERSILIVPAQPNVGISENNTLYVNLPAKVTGYGIDDEYVFSAVGHFKEGAPAKFVVEHLQFGGTAIPLPTLFGSEIVRSLMESYSQFDELETILDAWQRVESVVVADSSLKISIK